MWVFIDESGCTGMKLGGGSSPYFALAAIIFHDDEAAADARKAVRDVRRELGWHPQREFKFNKTDRTERLVFLKRAADLDFSVHSFVLNKAELDDNALRKPDQMYAKVTGWVIENALPSLDNARVIFDSCGNREFYDFLEQYIRGVISSKPHAIAEIRADNSHQNDLLQLADMVTGAIARYYGDKADARYYRTPMRKRLVNERFWPKTT